MGVKQIKERILTELGKSPKLAVYFTVAAICVAALILMRTPKKVTDPVPEHTVSEETVTHSYAEELEQKLKGVISEIKGVSDVTVMLTIDGTEEKVYAADTAESDSKTESKTVVVGSKEALLQATKYPKVRGVVVVCKGGNSAAVKEKVVNAVSTVLDIPTSKVYVTDAK